MSTNGCPTDAPTLCGESTLARGLCVPTEADCNIRSTDPRPFPGSDKFPKKTEQTQRKYGYGIYQDLMGRSCFTITIDYQQTYEDPDEIPDSFNLMSYNIWGMSKEPRFLKLFTLRTPLLLNTLKGANADMFCFQEMSGEAYEKMKPWIDTYKFASETPIVLKDSTGALLRNRDVDVYFVSKYRPMKLTIYRINGVLDYDNSFMVIEYPNLVIFNLYNQAGTRYSIGQEKYKLHYARCRYDILNYIYNMVPKDKSCILCGDINFDLDGSIEDYPELEMIDKFKANGFIDTYRKIHAVRGWTEDTDVNLMRWNNKLVHKKLRYDAIFYRPIKPLKIAASTIIGTELQDLNETDSKWFYETFSEASKTNRMNLLRGLKRTATGFTLPINPSDHFGIMTSFQPVVPKNTTTNKSQGNTWTVRATPHLSNNKSNNRWTVRAKPRVQRKKQSRKRR